MQLATVLLIAVPIVYFLSTYLHKYHPSKFENVTQFREYFLSQHPVGTAENVIDADLVDKRGFTKSKPWSFKTPVQIAPMAMVEKAEDHYLVTYFYITGYDELFPKEKSMDNALGYGFALRYSLDGHLINVQHRTGISRFSKGGETMVRAVF